METELTKLELNIKALAKLGIKVKHNSFSMENTIGGKQYFQLKDIDFAKSKVAFYIGAFHNKDSDGDIIMPGAYKKTIAENFSRFKHLVDHDRTLAPGAVQEVAEDSHGPFMVSQLAPSTLGKDTLIEYEYKIITEHSQGFQVVRQNEDRFQNANIITEIKLWEGSSLHAWGANPLTPVKGHEVEYLTNIKNLENILRNSSISDGLAITLTEHLEAMKKLFESKEEEKSEEITLSGDDHFYAELAKSLKD